MNFRALPKRAFPYVVVAVGGFMLAYAALFFFAFPADVLPDEGKLPNVVGLLYDDAAATLQKAGFYAHKGDQRFSRTAPDGSVLQQDPPGGSRQKRGIDVTLAVSAGTRTAAVPSIVGLTPQEARVAIENAGFQMGRTLELASDYPRGTVYQSSPAPGERRNLPSEVNITVSSGPATVQVPDLIGRTVPDARSALEQIGLKVRGIARDTSSIQPENSVIRQNPPPGSTVSAASGVAITISRFPPPQPLLPPDTLPRNPGPE